MSFLIKCCLLCCGGKKSKKSLDEDGSGEASKDHNLERVAKGEEDEEIGPKNNLDEDGDYSESIVPDIPEASPEVSDDESNGRKEKEPLTPVDSSSMISIDREDCSGDDGKCDEKIGNGDGPHNNGTTNDVDATTDAKKISKRGADVGAKDLVTKDNDSKEDLKNELPDFLKGGTTIPSYWGPIKQLYCRTGYHLAICPNGRVQGVRDEFHPYAALEFRSPAVGEVWIKGLKTGFYLTMNKKGRCIGQPNACHSGTLFIEKYKNGYNWYMSKKYRRKKWYVGIKKSGKIKPGHKTRKYQKAVQFLPRAIKPTSNLSQ